MNRYEVAVVFEIRSDSLEEAKQQVESYLIDINLYAKDKAEIPDYHHDNDGNRVVYLHPEDEALYANDDDETV